MLLRFMRSTILMILVLTGLTGCNFSFSNQTSATDVPATEISATIPATVDTGSPDSPFVRIDSPALQADGAPPVVSAINLTVSGEQYGSFENNVIVEVHSADGMVLDQVAVTALGNMGTVGTWEATLAPDATPGTSGIISAYFMSARDGSIVAEDQVPVTFSTSEG